MTWCPAMCSRASTDMNPVASGVKLMSSRWGLRVDAERHHKSLEGICPWGVRYMVWIVIPEEGYPHLKAWPGGHLTPSSCYWCASTFPTSSTRLGDICFPGFILVQLVLASVSVSDLKGTHLHRQSVYQLWWLNQWAKQTTPTTGVGLNCKV